MVKKQLGPDFDPLGQTFSLEEVPVDVNVVVLKEEAPTEEAPTEEAPTEEAPTEEAPKNHTVFVKSEGLSCIPLVVNGEKVKVLEGSVNGKSFKVICDQLTTVEADVYETLKPILARQ